MDEWTVERENTKADLQRRRKDGERRCRCGDLKFHHRLADGVWLCNFRDDCYCPYFEEEV